MIILNWLLLLWDFLEWKFSKLTESQKINWYEHQYNNKELTKFTSYNIKENKLLKKCNNDWFSNNKNVLIYCQWKKEFIFEKKEIKNWQDIIKENIIFLAFWNLLIFIYLKLLIPNIFSRKIILNNNQIITYINNKIQKYKDITESDLNQLESYINNSFKNNPNDYFKDLESLYILEKNSLLKGSKDISKKIKIISQKLKRKYLFHNWKYLNWLWNVFSYISSIYLTSTFVFFIFLSIFVFYNWILFKHIFYFSTNWEFLQQNFWYIYETINIASNLWGNTEGVNFIQQFFLSYLTVSWVIMFWVLLAIINEKINLK